MRKFKTDKIKSFILTVKDSMNRPLSINQLKYLYVILALFVLIGIINSIVLYKQIVG